MDIFVLLPYSPLTRLRRYDFPTISCREVVNGIGGAFLAATTTDHTKLRHQCNKIYVHFAYRLEVAGSSNQHFLVDVP